MGNLYFRRVYDVGADERRMEARTGKKEMPQIQVLRHIGVEGDFISL
jgi:hypothetical protein